MGKPTSETSLTLTRVTFSGGILEAVRGNDGDGWLSIAAACDSLGIDTTAQIERLKRTGWATGCITKPVALASDGKQREVFCLRSDRVAMWLATLDARRIKDPAVRERIENWQQHAADALDKWVRGEPAAQPGHRVAIEDPVNTIKALLGSMKTAQDEARADRLEFFAEMRAGREERKTTLGLMLKMTRMLRAAPSVATTSRAVKAQKTRPAQNSRERYGYQVDVALRLGMSRSSLSKFIERHPGLRDLQRKDGRWPVAKTVAAVKEIREKAETATHTVPVQPIATAEQLPLAPAKKPDRIYSPERLDLVKHMNVHALRNQRTETDQRSEDWQALYKRFKEWSHYNPYEVGAGRKQPLDIVEARGHMGALLSVAQKLFPLPDQHAHAC